jgi:histidyl-tRNA synthetase
MNNYKEAHEAVLEAQIRRMNALSDLVDKQDAGTADIADIKHLLEIADEAEKKHSEALQDFTRAAVAEIGEILATLSEVLEQK